MGNWEKVCVHVCVQGNNCLPPLERKIYQYVRNVADSQKTEGKWGWFDGVNRSPKLSPQEESHEKSKQSWVCAKCGLALTGSWRAFRVMGSHLERIEHPGRSFLPTLTLHSPPPLQSEESSFSLTVPVNLNAQGGTVGTNSNFWQIGEKGSPQAQKTE